MLLHARCALLNGELGKYTRWSPSELSQVLPRGGMTPRFFPIRKGQEEQLGALGLVLNVIVLWNTIYTKLRWNNRQGAQPVHQEDVARLSPLIYDHINLLGRYSFAIPEAVIRGELRPLHSGVIGLDDSRSVFVHAVVTSSND
jgi:Tn3 transposase DDE domain